MKYKKGDILNRIKATSENFLVRNVHKDNTYTIVTFLREKYVGRYSEDELEKMEITK